MADTELSKHPADSLEATLSLVVCSVSEHTSFMLTMTAQRDRQILSGCPFPGRQATRHCESSDISGIPAANLRFHDALDDIEVEIVSCQSLTSRAV